MSLRFDPDAPPRPRRGLDAPPPQVEPVDTQDGATIRLTRYEGGKKGPVILAHGAGYSSRVFSTDLPNENLVEFLTGHDYDVWLLDWRASTLLASASEKVDADQVADFDWPAAVREVQGATGAETIQAFAHCAGSQTLLMALASGLQGIRSAVCSQVGLHPIAPVGSRIAAALHVPGLLATLGMETVSAYTDERTGWRGKFLDSVISLVPRRPAEACESAVCHRLTAMYGRAYQHGQLSQRIHDNLHELFGVASLTLLNHVSGMVRVGHAISASGDERYMSHIDRLAVPIHFIHGEENQVYLPESTERTLDVLSEANGPDWYGRTTIPAYGHLDSIMGARAAQDVFPVIVAALD